MGGGGGLDLEHNGIHYWIQGLKYSMYHNPPSSNVACSLYSIEYILVDVICFVQVFSKIGNLC
jgi:hypothetical protein